LKILEMIDIQIAQKRYQNVKKKTFCKRCWKHIFEMF
jgi:hypothetical protein